MRHRHVVHNTLKIFRMLMLLLIMAVLNSIRMVAAEPLKILHVMSYEYEWPWSHEQFEGFQYALHGLDVEYRVVEMHSKQQSSSEWLASIGEQTRAIIDAWQPDMVYASDDNAQEYITKYYVNTNIPIVFSGVNAEPEVYGFVGSSNVTGVLEHEHFLASIRLLKTIQPDIKRIAVIIDSSPMWQPVIERMRAKVAELPDVEFVAWDTITTFRDYQAKVIAYQTTVDALGLLGIFEFQDDQGQNVNYTDVLKWTTEHSVLPDFSYWQDRIRYGTLCTVTVSGYDQGLAAGNMARGILVEGRRPDSYPIQPTVKGQPVVSLARARKLGIMLDSDILLNAKIITTFGWEADIHE